MMNPIRVVVVDDSALVRSVLTELINRSPDLKVIGSAADPYEAREKIRELDPDVITLDVEMPRMDGLAFLERMMRLRPTPAVMVSTLTERGAATTLRALELGAVDFVAKPTANVRNGLSALAAELTGKLRAAAQARVKRAAMPPAAVPAVSVPKPSATGQAHDHLIAIGASTGGTEAIREILCKLPAETPGIVITQHMPPGFTASFAARLDSLCALRVKEAADGDRVLQGHVYIAPGGKHMVIERHAMGGYVCRITDTEAVNRHKPSVEVMFQSVARVAGKRATGVMLTGMGADGAKAMREMRDRGAYNFVQDEASCVVFGMPKEAIAAGAASEVAPLGQIASKLVQRTGAVRGHPSS
ncbi:protein-glutamate methylesterase/protein-glutamine glutaminase [Ramlibacter humi]|uniref:Protein-glutamate methylesterase/protein-glutamine glutaminase n=1 Tax=Ramlibacter humi TaxID=2530451 RepID=A0A4Z0CBJ2_9BURK|nr:chemotaxis response regulator protein-glutamate methylesterase [Ramlibacter humi]TFZ09026.1 chemotaxis response regulator protein-glutamate methylesterase [Ramlibacter humi]